jgi:hypothetical protein
MVVEVEQAPEFLNQGQPTVHVVKSGALERQWRCAEDIKFNEFFEQFSQYVSDRSLLQLLYGHAWKEALAEYRKSDQGTLGRADVAP